MTTSIDTLLGQFIEAWNAGERPDVRDYLERAADADRDALADALTTWLEVAPAPAYDEATLAAIAREPALRAALDALEEREPVPAGAAFAALRERAGLGVDELAGRLTRLFGVGDEPRTAQYVERLERGDLDPSRLSRRLLAGLAAILGAGTTDLPARPALGTGQAFFRAEEGSDEWVAGAIDALSRAALAPAPEGEPMDELDRLFLGGPEA
jgi:transcriptional regulator with XRE-family HTH domain